MPNSAFLSPESNSNRTIIFYYESKSLEEQTNKYNQPIILENQNQYPAYTKEETYFANNENYPTTTYRGMDYMGYIVKTDDQYLKFEREYSIDQEEQQILVDILESLSH